MIDLCPTRFKKRQRARTICQRESAVHIINRYATIRILITITRQHNTAAGKNRRTVGIWNRGLSKALQPVLASQPFVEGTLPAAQYGRFSRAFIGFVKSFRPILCLEID